MLLEGQQPVVQLFHLPVGSVKPLAVDAVLLLDVVQALLENIVLVIRRLPPRNACTGLGVVRDRRHVLLERGEAATDLLHLRVCGLQGPRPLVAMVTHNVLEVVHALFKSGSVLIEGRLLAGQGGVRLLQLLHRRSVLLNSGQAAMHLLVPAVLVSRVTHELLHVVHALFQRRVMLVDRLVRALQCVQVPAVLLRRAANEVLEALNALLQRRDAAVERAGEGRGDRAAGAVCDTAMQLTERLLDLVKALIHGGVVRHARDASVQVLEPLLRGFDLTRVLVGAVPDRLLEILQALLER
mmetsp:Transcript_16731/g.43185  ORF Transcript_16731/g.43185 Transcript_16731/m.43185 type:complete len:297 (+) Transcript_16731:1344-2234(+)